MNRLFLALFSAPSLLGSALCWFTALPAPVRAYQTDETIQRVSDPILNAGEEQVCVFSQHSRFNLVCERVSQLKDAPKAPTLDLATDPWESPDASQFTEEESQAALALFGCDCQLCINSLRSLRLMAS